jgi:23S rRNA (guanosine2251-2'-O)-methyltransferase
MNEVLKVVGTHPVREAIKSGKEIEKILVSRETSNSELSEIVKIAKEKGIPVQKVPKIKLDKASEINHQGILAYISPVKFVEIDDIIEVATNYPELNALSEWTKNTIVPKVTEKLAKERS